MRKEIENVVINMRKLQVAGEIVLSMPCFWWTVKIDFSLSVILSELNLVIKHVFALLRFLDLMQIHLIIPSHLHRLHLRSSFVHELGLWLNWSCGEGLTEIVEVTTRSIRDRDSRVDGTWWSGWSAFSGVIMLLIRACCSDEGWLIYSVGRNVLGWGDFLAVAFRCASWTRVDIFSSNRLTWTRSDTTNESSGSVSIC